MQPGKPNNEAHCPGRRLPPGVDEARINVWTWIHTTSTAAQPRGGYRRASTSSCPFDQLGLMMQASHEPCNVSFVRKYGVDTPVTHAL
jgi:hypothetical protein